MAPERRRLGDPDDFVGSLNAALVSLRSTPEMLDEERQRVPDFYAWYAPHGAAFRTDPLLRWLVKARNDVALLLPGDSGAPGLPACVRSAFGEVRCQARILLISTDRVLAS